MLRDRWVPLQRSQFLVKDSHRHFDNIVPQNSALGF
jgi:hypothetical protein